MAMDVHPESARQYYDGHPLVSDLPLAFISSCSPYAAADAYPDSYIASYPEGDEVLEHDRALVLQPRVDIGVSQRDYRVPLLGTSSPDACIQQVTFPSAATVDNPWRHRAAGGNGGVTGGKPKRRRVQTQSQRKAANIRERRRMFHLNEAFDELRKRLPAFNYEKRLSRIETLRLAITYISFMKEITNGKDPGKVELHKHKKLDDILQELEDCEDEEDEDDDDEDDDSSSMDK